MNAADTGRKRIRVLIVEDSAVVRELLAYLFESDPDTEVAGVVNDGAEALAAVLRLQPDVVTMDINMPRMDGFEATRQIMGVQPTPIVIVSGSWDPREVSVSFRAIEAGALAMLARPRGAGHPEFAAETRDLLRTVKAMAEVKLVRRWPARNSATNGTEPATAGAAASSEDHRRFSVRLLVIGASTGGPIVLQKILASLPAELPFPVAIVQHMAAGFVDGFVNWLAQSTRFPIQLAVHGETMQPGRAYVAPDGVHLRVREGGGIDLSDEPPVSGLRPAVSLLFQSAAQVYGRYTCAVLLTGMGSDGAHELKQLKDLGAATVIQDKASSVVFGMPGTAAMLGAACWTLPPERIAELIGRFARTAKN